MIYVLSQEIFQWVNPPNKLIYTLYIYINLMHILSVSENGNFEVSLSIDHK